VVPDEPKARSGTPTSSRPRRTSQNQLEVPDTALRAVPGRRSWRYTKPASCGARPRRAHVRRDV